MHRRAPSRIAPLALALAACTAHTPDLQHPSATCRDPSGYEVDCRFALRATPVIPDADPIAPAEPEPEPEPTPELVADPSDPQTSTDPAAPTDALASTEARPRQFGCKLFPDRPPHARPPKTLATDAPHAGPSFDRRIAAELAHARRLARREDRRDRLATP